MGTPSVRKECRHCRRVLLIRPKGLCWTCYFTPAVRALYPSDSRYRPRHPDAVTGAGFRNDQRPLPPHPTDAAPGTEAKQQVMMERLLAGYHLHHPLDVRGHNEELSNVG